MKTSIVIPAYNRYDLLNQLLLDLYQHNSLDIDELVIVNDASTEKGFLNGLNEFWSGLFPNSVVVNNANNLGFLLSSNEGMDEARGDILFLISTDVRVRSPLAPAILRLQEKPSDIIGNRYINFDTGWNVFDGKIFPYLEGWFLGCTKTAWRELGGFDVQYAPNDYEDIDFSTTAVSKGYDLVSLDDPKITHIGGQTLTFSPEREALTKRNKEKFRKKWML